MDKLQKFLAALVLSMITYFWQANYYGTYVVAGSKIYYSAAEWALFYHGIACGIIVGMVILMHHERKQRTTPKIE